MILLSLPLKVLSLGLRVDLKFKSGLHTADTEGLVSVNKMEKERKAKEVETC